MRVRLFLTALLLADGAARATAQAAALPPHLGDSSVARIMTLLRGNLGPLARILRQADGSNTQVKLDSLADDLVRIATAVRPSMALPGGDMSGASDAIRTLRSAGSDDPRADGLPYGPAVDRLYRIYDQGHEPGVRLAALQAMLSVDGRPRAVSYLFQIATSVDSLAVSAMDQLQRDTGVDQGAPPAEQAAVTSRLHQLFDRVTAEPWNPVVEGKRQGKASVPDEDALELLMRFANLNGWARG